VWLLLSWLWFLCVGIFVSVHLLKGAGRARQRGLALGVHELIAHHRIFDVLIDLLVRAGLVMMRVSVDDHEIFVVLILGLLVRMREKALGVEFVLTGIPN